MELQTLRAIERVLDVVFAGISIYLGYRLFAAAGMAAPQSSEARLDAGKYRFRMAKVGAGAFFALFGAVVMIVSLMSKAEIKPNQFYAATVLDTADRQIAAQRVAALNRAAWNLRPDLPVQEKQDILSAIAELKAAEIESIWLPAWGGAASKREFRSWALSGGQGAGPAGLSAPAELFHAGASP